MPRRSTVPGGAQHPLVVALGQHDPLRVARGALDEVVLEHQRRDDVAAGHAEAVEQVVGVDVPVEQRERGLDLARRVAVSRPRTALERGRRPERAAVGASTIGSPTPRPSISRDDRPGSSNPPFSTTPASGGKVFDACAAARRAARRCGRRNDHDARRRAAGQHVGHRHARHDQPADLAAQRDGSPRSSSPPHGAHDVAHRRRHQHRLLGHRPGRAVPHRQRAATRGVECAARSTRFATTAKSSAVRRRGQLGGRQLGGGAQARTGELVVPVERQQHRRAEVRRDPRVEGELRRAADVGVVAADHDDGVALRSATAWYRSTMRPIAASGSACTSSYVTPMHSS